MRPVGPRTLARRLESAIGAGARAAGIAIPRYRDQFNRTILIATLDRAVDAGRIPDYLIKGGAAIELRFGAAARTTRDLDVELPVPLARLYHTFAAALAYAPEDFTFTLRAEVREVREDAVRVVVVMQFAGQGWATIDVDLASANDVEIVDQIHIEATELPGVSARARTMRTEFLIAQKIHAILTPDEADYQYAYARHVVDVLFLAPQSSPESIRHACEAVFTTRAARSGRTWPPQSIMLPDRWLRDYGATITLYPDLSIAAADVPIAFTNLLTEVIGGITLMPGYEYQFVVLKFNVGENPQDEAFGSPIDTRSLKYEGFTNLTRQGFRIRTTTEIAERTGNPELLVTLERELPEQAG